MTEDVRKKLAGELLRDVHWDLVKPHVIREAVFQVVGLPLIDVGEALACDDGEKVAGWVEQGRLARPDRPTLERWRDQDVRFATLIVSPFVLVQEEPRKVDGVQRLYWGPVETTEDQLLVAFWPAPVDHDVCFQAAGFDAFLERDLLWEREFKELVGRLVRVLSEFGEPTCESVPADDLVEQIICVATSDSKSGVTVRFGEGVELQTGYGHPIFWLSAAHHREVSMDIVLRKIAIDLRIDRLELDWKALAPPQLQRVTGVH